MKRAWVLLAAIAASVGCGSRDAERPEPTVPPPWRDEGRAVALLASADARYDFAWVDVLEFAFGRVDVLDTADDAVWGPALGNRSVVWIGHDTLRRLRPSDLPAVETFVRGGGALVLESPDTTWAPMAGLRVASAERSERAPWPLENDAANAFGDGRGAGLTARETKGLLPSTGFVDALFDLPLSVRRYAPARDRRLAARPRVRAAGRPAVWTRPLDSGAIVSISPWLARLHADAVGRDPTAPPIDAPVHDAWVTRLLESDAAPTPWPRWSAAPFGLDGVVASGDVSRTGTGFTLATALPFHHLDPAGRPLDALALGELALAGATSRDVVRALARNAAIGAGPLLLHAPTIALDDVASRASHRVVDASWIRGWWAARAQARLAWSRPDELVVAVESPVGDENLGLLLPSVWRDEVLVGWTAPWSPAPSRRIVRGGRTWVEIGIPPGTKARLRATYRPRFER